VILKNQSLGFLQITNSAGTAILDWIGNSGGSLQKSTNLASSIWQTVPATSGASHFQEPITNGTVFYRLIQ
jgi:hypothetical protein